MYFGNKLIIFPDALQLINWEKSFAWVYFRDNPNLMFSMCEVRLVPKIRRTMKEGFTQKKGVWKLQNKITKEVTAHAFIRIDDDSLKKIEN